MASTAAAYPIAGKHSWVAPSLDGFITESHTTEVGGRRFVSILISAANFFHTGHCRGHELRLLLSEPGRSVDSPYDHRHVSHHVGSRICQPIHRFQNFK